MKTSFSSFHPPTQHLTAQLNSSPTGATMGPFPPKAGHQLQLNWQPAGIHTCHGGGFQPPSRWRPVRGVETPSRSPTYWQALAVRSSVLVANGPSEVIPGTVFDVH